MKKNRFKIETNEVTPEMKKSLVVRVITAICIVVIGVPCAFIGSWAFAALAAFIAAAVGFEIVHSSRPSKRFRIPIYIITITLIESYVFWIFIKNNVSAIISPTDQDPANLWTIFNMNFTDISISIIALITTAMFYFMFSFLDDDTTIPQVMYYIAMSAICGVAIQSMMYLRFSPFSAFSTHDYYKTIVNVNDPLFMYLQSTTLLVYLLFGAIFNDTGAYFVGILFGKHKVNPRISPKKTWEGFAGGIIFSFIISAGFAFILAGCGVPIFPYLDLSHWYYIIILSLLIPVVSDLGDFVFSAIKRNFGIKDFSQVLPGHGGILDRFDSIFFASVVTSCFLIMTTGGWRFGLM